MAVQLPDGAIVSLATDYDEAVDVDSVTNAAKAVLTLNGEHGIVKGDVFEFTSGWSDAANRVFVAEEVSDKEVTINLDSSNMERFREGAGVGAIRKITKWETVQQIVSFEGQGGEPEYADYDFLDSDMKNQIPTGFSAQTFSIGIGDDEKMPGYIAYLAASEARSVRALEVRLRSGSAIYYNGYPAINPTPTMTKGQIMTVRASYSVIGRAVRY